MKILLEGSGVVPRGQTGRRLDWEDITRLIVAFHDFFTNVSVMWEVNCTRVGTIIVATIYLQLIQNRYMFRSFTALQCSHQHCVQPVASDRIPLAAPVVLIVRMERSTVWRISGTVLKRMPRSGSFMLGIKWKSQGLKPLWLRLDS